MAPNAPRGRSPSFKGGGPISAGGTGTSSRAARSQETAVAMDAGVGFVGGRGGGEWGRGRGPGRGRGRHSSDPRGGSRSSPASLDETRELFKCLLKKLTNGQPWCPNELARFLDVAWQLLQLGDEDRVLQALADKGAGGDRASSGLVLLTAVAQSTGGADCKLHPSVSSMKAANNALPFLQCYVPLIRLLGDQLTHCSTLQQHTNPVYAVITMVARA